MTTVKDALAEAYASAPHQEIIYWTLEIRHSSFLDDEGNPVAIRLVRDEEDLMARLEPDAPLNAGEEVEFINCPWEFTLPKVEEGAAPEAKLGISNVTRYITPYLENGVSQLTALEITLRPYLLSDLSGPQMDPVLTLVLTKVSVDAFSVSGTAGADDMVNYPFPGDTYNTSRFRNLA